MTIGQASAQRAHTGISGFLPVPPTASLGNTLPLACSSLAAFILRRTQRPRGLGSHTLGDSLQPPAPGHHADSPPLEGPGCAEATWARAGAPKPSSFSMPAISLSCWARKAAAGSSSAASAAPLSDDEKKPKSSAIFPESPLKKPPPGAQLCPARPGCAPRPRHCHRAARGAAARGRARRCAPHFLSATGPGSPVTAAAGAEREELGTELR